MAYFVGDNFGDLLLDPDAAIFVDQEHDLPKRDGSPVLHRSSGKLRDRDKMQLGKVVLRTKIGLEEFDRISGDVWRILRTRTLARYGSYYVVDSVEPVFHFFKLADSQVQEVRGHSRSLWKLDSLLWTLHRHRHRRHVGNYGGVAVCSDCKLEVSLVSGVVQTWQETPGRDGLELCRGHVAAVIRCLVQTYELVRDRASVFDVEFSRELLGPNRKVFSF